MIMADSFGHVLSHIQRWTSPRLGDLSDAVLLERFVRSRDESAFAALVARHGGMVLRSCRRVLGDVYEAEDAFQATFLILARKAHTLRQSAALPGFLHCIARRVALKARHKSAVRAGEERLAEEVPDSSADPLARLTARELLTVFDEELSRLPMAQQSAVMLCCLEGHTQEEAARLLGWTAGSLRGHLDRGRNRLLARLLRRGISLPAALAVVVLSRGEAATARLLQTTVKAALDGGMSSSSAVLAQGILQTMFVRKLAGMTAATLTLALAASVALTLASRVPVAEAPEDKTPAVPVVRKSAEAPPAARVDRYGDPLPPHALARFGSVRYRHQWTIFTSAISPDGRLLAGAGGQSVQIWEAETGRTVQRWSLPSYGSFVLALAFMPDGKNLASYAEVETDTAIKGQSELLTQLRITDVVTGKTIRQFDRAKYRAGSKNIGVPYLAFLTGGKQLLLRDQRETVVHLLDAQSGEEIRAFRCAGDPLHSFATSPDGQLLAVGEHSGTVRLWEVATGKERFALKRHRGSCGALTFSPDNKILASGDAEGAAYLWDVAAGNIVYMLDPKIDQGPGNRLGVGSLSFAPDGKSLLSSHRYWAVFWDTTTGEEIRRMPNEPTRALRYLPDGKTLIAGGDNYWGRVDNMFRFFDVETGKPCRNFDGLGASIQALAYSSDGKYIAACDGGNTAPPELRVWEVSSGRVVFQNITRDTVHMTALAFSPKADVLAAAHWNTITLWDLKSGKPRRTLPNTRAAPSGSLAFSTDGTKLACAGQDDSIRVWDLANGKELVNLHLEVKEDGHPPSVRDVTFSPDLRLVAYGGWGASSIRLRDLSTGKVWKSIHRGGVGWPVNVAFSPDGRTLLETSEGGRKMFLWEVATGQLRRSLSLSSFPHWDVAFSPDGRRIAVTQDPMDRRNLNKEPSIWLFDLASNRPPAKRFGHEGRINVLSFSPDSRILASGSSDTTVLLWDVAKLDPDTPPAPLTPEQRAACWNDLAGDAKRAYDALWKLVNDPGSLELFREKLKPAPTPAEAKLVGQLLADLGSDQFPVRSKAQEQLAKLGIAAEAQLRNALTHKTGLELRKRVEVLLATIESERLRTRRALEALELINTASARQWLEKLAHGPAGAWLTGEAKETLGRLGLRPAR
jgi:RNA polymerase sigma factor (sigma-70 family)